jgi:hypothetical protein
MLEVAKKKPRVQAAIDRALDLTDEEIDALQDIPAWMKKHLKHHKFLNHKREAGYLDPEEIAAVMAEKSS